MRRGGNFGGDNYQASIDSHARKQREYFLENLEAMSVVSLARAWRLIDHMALVHGHKILSAATTGNYPL